jgi:hypothetical protein
MRNKTLCKTLFLLLVSFVLLSYNDDPPNGRTGAPFDGNCCDCHPDNNPGGFNGTAEILGLPDTIQPNTNYQFQIKATVIAGNPVRAGFQLVVVDKNNINAGNLSAANTDTDTEFLNGREYLDHRSGKYFQGAPVSWHFNWTSPATADCNKIKFYYIVNFCNGSGDFGDHSIAFADSVYFAGGAPLTLTVETVQNNTCLQDMHGIAHAEAGGGNPPYAYHWSNGSTNANLESLANGIYTVNILDNVGCSTVDSTRISPFDSIPPQMSCPGSLTVCTGDTVQFDLPTITDHCALADTLPVLLSGLPSGSLFPSGITEIVFQATDESGNQATCTFQVKVDSCPVGTTHVVERDKALLIVPNPVSETFFVQGLEEAPLAMTLINLQGAVVRSFPISAWPGPFYVADIPYAVYGLRVLFEDKHRSLLLIIESKR